MALARLLLAIAIGTAATASSAPDPPALGEVRLPVADYLALVAAGRTQEATKGQVAESGYAAVEHVLEVDAAGARLETTLEAFALGGNGGELALPDLGLMYEAEVLSGEASLRSQKEAAPRLRIGRAGRARLRLRSALERSRQPGEESLSWEVPAAGAARLEVRLPRGQDDVRFAGGTLSLVATEEGVRGGGSLEAGRRVTLVYGTKGDQDPGAELLATVSDGRVYVVGERTLTLGVWLTIEVLRGRLERFELEAPLGLEVVSASAAGNTVVSLERNEEGRLLGKLGQAVASGHAELYVQLEGEWPEGDGGEALPEVKVVGLERGESVLAVTSRKPLLVVEQGRDGYERIDEGNLPDRLRGALETPVLYAARGEGAGARRLVLAVRSFADADGLSGIVDEAKVLTLWGGNGRRIDALELTLQSREPVLRLSVPEGSEVWSVELDGEGVRPLKEAGEILVPLGRGEESRGERKVKLVVAGPVGKGVPGSGRFALAPLPLPYAATVATWDVLLPEDLDYQVLAGAWRHEPPSSPPSPTRKSRQGWFGRHKKAESIPPAPTSGALAEVPVVELHSDVTTSLREELVKRIPSGVVLQSATSSSITEVRRSTEAGVAAIPVSLPERGKRIRLSRHLVAAEPAPVELALRSRRAKKGGVGRLPEEP